MRGPADVPGGVCTSSSGVAHLNALTGLANAYFDGAPMPLITGARDSPTAGLRDRARDRLSWADTRSETVRDF